MGAKGRPPKADRSDKKMKYYVYVIKNENNQLYKGWTTNLEKRIYYHNQGLSNYTKNRGPWKLVYYEMYNNKNEAIKREKFLKSGKGREFLKKIFSERSSDG